MIEYPLKGITIISREPGNEDVNGFAEGDVIEVETTGGFLKAIDPITYEAKGTNQRFRVKSDGKGLDIVKD